MNLPYNFHRGGITSRDGGSAVKQMFEFFILETIPRILPDDINKIQISHLKDYFQILLFSKILTLALASTAKTKKTF